MMRQYMAAVPDELIEAARIDSAGEFTIFHRIVLPDVIPAVSALGIFQFLWVWDDYLWPFLMMQSMDRYTLPVGLSLFNGQYYNDNGGIFAAATISVLPVILVYLLFQRQFVEGIALTGIKG
jgi:multiple sugar transport system permease protein/raffinose/stachyose/melibiose transport system permease protein